MKSNYKARNSGRHVLWRYHFDYIIKMTSLLPINIRLGSSYFLQRNIFLSLLSHPSRLPYFRVKLWRWWIPSTTNLLHHRRRFQPPPLFGHPLRDLLYVLLYSSGKKTSHNHPETPITATVADCCQQPPLFSLKIDEQKLPTLTYQRIRSPTGYVIETHFFRYLFFIKRLIFGNFMASLRADFRWPRIVFFDTSRPTLRPQEVIFPEKCNGWKVRSHSSYLK